MRWVPNTDTDARDDGFVIKCELAGMQRSDLDLTAEANRLRIRGIRHRGDRPETGVPQPDGQIHYGPFEIVVEVPSRYDLARAQAAYRNGFLRVDVPLANSQPTNRAGGQAVEPPPLPNWRRGHGDAQNPS